MAGLYITMTSVALEVAARAFAGKTDKTGREGAVLHSLRVFEAVRGDEITEAAALLHDTIEDTEITEADLRTIFAEYPVGKVEDLVATVLALTRGFINRDTKEMVFSPPPAAMVCDCEYRKCIKPEQHIYDKELYRNFVERSKRNPRSRAIKIADITDNMSPSRVEGLGEEDKGIVEERYVPALAFLRDPKAEKFFTPRQLARICVHCRKPFSAHGKDGLCPSVQSEMFPKEHTTFKGTKG